MISIKQSALIQSLKNRPRLSALLELLFFVGLILLFDRFSGDANRYWGVHPHPFWMVILLIAIQYGANEGLLAVVVCSLALLAWNLPVTSINENIYDYLLRVAQRPILWTLVTVIIGEMASRLKLTINDLQTELKRVLLREEAITKGYKNLKGIKEQMETRLVGQLRSSIDSFKAVRSVDSLNPVHLMKDIGKVILSITGPEQLSLYLLTRTGFELVDHHGWPDEMAYARHFPADSPLFQTIASQHRVLCVINEADATLLEDEGVMAGPLIDPSTQMLFGMVKIERLDFMQLTQTNVDTFKIMLEWAGATFTQARQYHKAYTDLVHNPKSGMLSSNFYQYYCRYLQQVAQTSGASFFQLNLGVKLPRGGNRTSKVQIARALVDYAKASLPHDILLFTKKMNHTAFAIIPIFISPPEQEKLKNQVQTFIDLQLKIYPEFSFTLDWEPL